MCIDQVAKEVWYIFDTLIWGSLLYFRMSISPFSDTRILRMKIDMEKNLVLNSVILSCLSINRFVELLF